MMPVYGTQWEWHYFPRQPGHMCEVKYIWKFKVSMFLFGYGFIYSDQGSKYPPDFKPKWRPIRDFLAYLKDGSDIQETREYRRRQKAVAKAKKSRMRRDSPYEERTLTVDSSGQHRPWYGELCEGCENRINNKDWPIDGYLCIDCGIEWKTHVRGWTAPKPTKPTVDRVAAPHRNRYIA